MATRGRKPLPTALKELEGDRGHGRRPINHNEPRPPQTAVECPDWLLPEAKAEWDRLAPTLIAMGVITDHDITAFAGYCQSYARWKEAEEWMAEHGTTFTSEKDGVLRPVPQVRISQSNLHSMQAFCSEFGLTPASRARIYANMDTGSGEDDPMESLLGGGWRVV